MPKVPQLLAVLPIAGLLTTSFFVLVINRKIEEKGLRTFGNFVAGFLWGAALIVLAVAAFDLGKAACGAKKYSKFQPEPGPGGMHAAMMYQGNSPAANPAAKVMPRVSGCSSCAGNKGTVTKSE